MLTNVNWKNYFDVRTLNAGLDYYTKGKVTNLKNTDPKMDMYHCTVTGTKKYQVSVFKNAAKRIVLSCSCPYAWSGNYCKHMAAMFYAVETYEKGIGDMQPVKSRFVKLFKDSDRQENDYSYYDVPYIVRNLKVSEDSLKKARAMADEMYESIDTDACRTYETYGNSYAKTLDVAAMYGKNSQAVSLRLKMMPEQIVSLRCSCPKCNEAIFTEYYYDYFDNNKELCEYKAALILAVKKLVDVYNPGDISNHLTDRLIDNYANYDNVVEGEIVESVSEEPRKIRKTLELYPRVSNSRGGIVTSFRINNGKKYIIKSIPELVNAVENQETMTLGTKGSVDFSKEGFTEESEKLYEILKASYKETVARMNAMDAMGQYSADSRVKDSVLLIGSQLDSFFDLFENKSVEYNGYYGMSDSKISFNTSDYVPKLTIESVSDKRNVFQGIRLSGHLPDLIMGSKYGYIENNQIFSRISEQSMRGLEKLKKLASYGGAIEIYIGRKKLAEFYYGVLPNLKKLASVEDKSNVDVTNFIPADAEFRFYVDSENDDVTCKMEVYYGEDKYDLTPTFMENDFGDSPDRNYGKETKVFEEVRKLFPYATEDCSKLCCQRDENLIYDVVTSGLASLMKFGEVMVTENFKKLTVRRVPKVSVGVRVESNLLELTVSTDDLSRDELLALLESFRKKRKYYRLKNGDLVKTDDDTLKELSAVMDAMHISSKEFLRENMKMPLYRALYLDKLLEGNGALYAERDKHFKEVVRNFKTVEESDYEPPVSLKNTLRNYQSHGYKWLKTVASSGFGGILADDMGLGKTLQVISFLLGEKEKAQEVIINENGETVVSKSPLSIIITPASLCYNWAEEFRRFAPSMNFKVVAGALSERKNIIHDLQDTDVLITSYDLLKRDIAEYEGIEFDYEIIDEAQYIKNHGTAAAKSVKAISSKCRFALTGTPIENRLSELWSIFDYLMPGFLYGYDIFKKEMETPIAKNKNEEITDRLKKMVAPFILRRLKGDVLKDLPEKLEEVQTAVFDAEQRHLYDAEVIRIQELLNNESEEDFNKARFQLLAELTRIRQICCDPSLLFADYKGASAKLEAAMDLIKSAIEGEHRILLFSQFTSMLAILQEKLNEEGIKYYLITGETPKPERLELVNKFNNDDTPIFLISLKAGGTGLNLTGADVVIHYDPWWNVAAQNQATDRAHRIGQTKVVTVYKLIVKDTIEEKILEMQRSKQDLADAILSGEMGGLMNMSREELLELVK